MKSSHAWKHILQTTAIVFAFSLSSVCLVACGNSDATAASSTQATSTANCTQNNQPRTRGAANGVVQSVQSNALVITTPNNGNVQVNLSSTTTVSKMELVDLSTLKEGASVTVQVQQQSDGSYSATALLVNTGTNGQNFQRGNFRNGNGNGPRRNPACATRVPTGQNGTQNPTGRVVFGTLGQINGQQVTVTDVQGNDYSVNVDSSTKIVETVTGTVADLKVGETVTTSGTAINQGSMTAQSITITLPGILSGFGRGGSSN